MGKIYQGILGGVSKRVGSVVGASWKGIPVIRSYQPNVSNPRTAGQIAVRSKFKTIGLIASGMLSANIKFMWDRFAVRMSGYNAFVQANYGAFGADGAFDVTKVVASKGKMDGTAIIGSIVDSGFVIVDWDTPLSGRLQLATDVPVISVISNDGAVSFAGSEVSTTRADGTARIAIPLYAQAAIKAGTATAFLSFVRADNSVVSGSTLALLTNP